MPSAISVNMLRWRVRSDCAPRTKNGHPPQSTTGVANTSCVSADAVCDSGAKPNKCAPISSTTTGNASTAEIQSRRVISASSAPSSAPPASGSSAMPQIGQVPGPTCRICGMHRAGIDRAFRRGRCGRRSGRAVQIFVRIGDELAAATGAAERVGMAVVVCAVRRFCRNRLSSRKPDRSSASPPSCE